MSIADKHVIFCGANSGSPSRDSHLWSPRTTMGKIVERALAPLGYEVDIDPRGFGMANLRLVSAGEADLGAIGGDQAWWAYEGKYDFAGEARRNLRVIASIHFPAWLGVAVRWETGLTSLTQIKERHLPLRVVGANGPQADMVLSHYGLSRELIESWGGKFLRVTGNALTWFITSGDYDMIIDAIYAANTPEARHWWEATVRHELRFLPLADDLIGQVARETGGEPGFIPHQLMRGVVGDIPSVARSPHVIYGRDDTPDDFAYLLAQTLDENRHLFRQVYLPYSYDPKTVARDSGVPLHPGAAAYYREAGYVLEAVVAGR
jgi:TRAP transporter TAXI family solute receptor